MNEYEYSIMEKTDFHPSPNRKLWCFWIFFVFGALVLCILQLDILILTTCKVEINEKYHQQVDTRTSEVFTEQEGVIPEYLRKVRSLTNCVNNRNEFRLEYKGNFIVLKNYVKGSQKPVNCFETITYTTHGDVTFLDNLPHLIQRWKAPVSFALYTPGDDYDRAIESVLHLRNCIEQSSLIKNFVTFHFFFDLDHSPKSLDLNFSSNEANYTCGPDPFYLSGATTETYKSNHSLPYFINTARNIAINAAVTHFIFASDVELWPNPGIIESFLKMYAKLQHTPDQKEVFVLPVFEVEKNASVPSSKVALQKMIKDRTAIIFHENGHKKCHETPKEVEWIQTPEANEMKIFATTKRTGKFEVWEPFYISSRHIPEFDERLTWELRGNKLIHAYVLCLLDYDFHVLNNAFLVHRPGIKTAEEGNTGRASSDGNRLIKYTVQPQLKSFYGDRDGCIVKYLNDV